MLISLQYTALYRIGSKYEYIMSVCMTWGKFLFDLVNKRGQAECRKRRRINYYKSKQRLLFLASKFVLETRYAGHTLSHTRTCTGIHTEVTHEPQPQRLVSGFVVAFVALHVHYINPVPVPVWFFSPTFFYGSLSRKAF